MKVFFDTNLPIAHVFEINSLHFKSEYVFKFYKEFFWSSFVKNEFDRRYNEKLDNLLDFFFKLQINLVNPEKEFYSSSDLIEFVNSNYSGKIRNDVKSSINPFWSKYIGIESQVPFFNIKTKVDNCLNDLSLNSNNKKMNLEKIMQLTPQRKKSYSNIDSMLKSEGVNLQDRIVTLDGHDFACRSSNPIDFVTFDDTCYNDAKKVEILCFSSIKGEQDFIAS